MIARLALAALTVVLLAATYQPTLGRTTSATVGATEPTAAAVPHKKGSGRSAVDPSVAIALVVALGALLSAFGIGTLITNSAKHRSSLADKRTEAHTALCFHLQSLEKRMVVVHEFLVLDSGEDDYRTLTDALRAVVLPCAGLFRKEQKTALMAALNSCTTEASYLSGQRTRALTNQAAPEIKAAARRALLSIYTARDALGDQMVLLWPPDIENRRLWNAGDVIRRVQ